jgi:hypothetical protein
VIGARIDLMPHRHVAGGQPRRHLRRIALRIDQRVVAGCADERRRRTRQRERDRL